HLHRLHGSGLDEVASRLRPPRSLRGSFLRDYDGISKELPRRFGLLPTRKASPARAPFRCPPRSGTLPELPAADTVPLIDLPRADGARAGVVPASQQGETIAAECLQDSTGQPFGIALPRRVTSTATPQVAGEAVPPLQVGDLVGRDSHQDFDCVGQVEI